MRKFLKLALCTLSFLAIAFGCSDRLDIKQDYAFEVHHLPVQSKIKKGETVEIRFQLVREGRWDGAKYYMRYFCSQGRGELRTGDGMVFQVNDLYEIPEETFRLYYTSLSDEQQAIDLYFLSDSGQTVTLSFSFSSEKNCKIK
jgi:hypothetical protein